MARHNPKSSSTGVDETIDDAEVEPGISRLELGVAVENTFARSLPELVVPWTASPVAEPAMVVFNSDLALDLRLPEDRLDDLAGGGGAEMFSGNRPIRGSESVAMAYAGHQFGGYSPRLGDGRALLVGEIVGRSGRRVDIHLKGSGRTPFARGGDGRAELAPMLREYLVAEAMNALGVPTGRALAVVCTGEQVMRRGPVPGGILTRVASSHIRVGTFEYAVRLPDRTVLRRLADYTIVRHHPDLVDTDRPYLRLLERVVESQARLIAQWMLVGFIHGVMNTDNMAISGETIDYGPCAFLDAYDSGAVFSSIDHQGRYAFGNQPTMAHWNLSRLAETLLPLVVDNEAVFTEDASPSDSDELKAAIGAATEVLDSFADRFRGHWIRGMATKLGLARPDEPQVVDNPIPAGGDVDGGLFGDLVELMQEAGADHTLTYRALARYLRGDGDSPWTVFDPDRIERARVEAWLQRWTAEIDGAGDRMEAADAMDRVNPLYIPRNHLVEEALAAATAGDLEPFHQLLAVVTRPYDRRPGVDPEADRYAQPAPGGFYAGFQTFCGT